MRSQGSIVIGDPEAAVAAARAEALAAAGYRTAVACDPTALLSLAAARRPDVALIGGFAAPDDALALCEALRDGPVTAATPLVLTGAAASEMTPEARRRALDIGVDDMLPADAGAEELLARLPRLVRAAVMQAELARRVETAAAFGRLVDPADFSRDYAARPRIMTVSESGGLLSDLQQILLLAGFHALPERSAYRAGERIDDERVDAAVIGLADAADMERAAALAAHIRANPRLFNLPTLIVGEAIGAEDRTRLYGAGVSIVASGRAPLEEPEGLTAYLHMLVARQRRRWTLRDPFKATLGAQTGDADLAGVYSAAFLHAHLARQIADAAARETDLTVAVLRIDNIAGVAERHGGESARVLMQQMADWIAGMTRIEDAVGRLGADSFAVLLPETPVDEAERVLQRLIGVLHQSEFHLTEEVMEPARVWPSAGIAARRPHDDADALLARAASMRY